MWYMLVLDQRFGYGNKISLCGTQYLSGATKYCIELIEPTHRTHQDLAPTPGVASRQNMRDKNIKRATSKCIPTAQLCQLCWISCCFLRSLYLSKFHIRDQNYYVWVCNSPIAFQWHRNRWPWMTPNSYFALGLYILFSEWHHLARMLWF